MTLPVRVIKLGGSLLAFTWRGRDILRRAKGRPSDPRAGAGFPLVPFCNRLRGGVLPTRHTTRSVGKGR